MATFEAVAVPVTFVDSAGLRVAQWQITDRAILRMKREGKTAADGVALFEEAKAGLMARGAPFKLMVSVQKGRRPAGFPEREMTLDWEPTAEVAPSSLAA